MKVKIQNVPTGERFILNGKDISVGETVDLPKESAVYFIGRGLAIEIKEKKTTNKGVINHGS